MPVTATPWRMVPSTPARSAYLAWKSLVSWAARAASWAWRASRGCTVSWRRPDAEVVHWARTGPGPQMPFAKVITMVSVPRWMDGFRELLAWPCGQVAFAIDFGARQARGDAGSARRETLRLPLPPSSHLPSPLAGGGEVVLHEHDPQHPGRMQPRQERQIRITAGGGVHRCQH